MSDSLKSENIIQKCFITQQFKSDCRSVATLSVSFDQFDSRSV